ncbi:MAG: HIT domain-containing protein [Patescibacteria group bacterium]|nr:HIT domain-containing protein [Patescibacteria group bacterium]MDE2590143.1 HIT domain-containing protein [Patescibacteria group bacterium]
MIDCIFCKIANKEIPKEFTYEDDEIMVFPDIRPIKPVHLLIIPKKHISDFTALDDDALLGRIRHVIQKLVKDHEVENSGYRIVVNAGGAQAIDHLHFHLTAPWGKAAVL